MKIICIGRNYSAHIKELDNEEPTVPIFFMKPETALLPRNRPFYLPPFSNEIQYETEIVFKICKVGKYISEKFAHRYYDQIAIGLDLTARDLQRNAQKNGLPWEVSKSFDYSAPLSRFEPVSNFKDIHNLNFSLKKNGEMVQQGNTSQMIFSINQIIAYVSQFVMLKIGDIIFTGTPQGVGNLAIGDLLEAFIEDKKLLQCQIR